MNYILKYNKAIENGLVVSKRVKRIYARLAKELEGERWHFDEDRANRPIEFIEEFCRHSKGEWARKKIKLELFQKAFISALFGFIDDDGVRRFKEALFLMARKNGKSTLLAGIQLYMLTSDYEDGAEVYSVATKRDQAKITFNEALNMVKQSPELSKVLRKRKTDIYDDYTFSKLEALASESKSLDGLNSHCVVIDELHAIKDRQLYEVMKQSMSARRQPMMVMITTAGTVRECIYDDMYDYGCKVADGVIEDERFLPILYELDEKEEWTKEECWRKANPGLGTIKKLDDLAERVERAKKNPKELPGILCKDFNIRSTGINSWLTFQQINNEERYNLEDHKGTYAVGGVDLSSTTDLTCATVMWEKDKLYVRQMYFIPSEVAQKKEDEDRVPYRLWSEQGYVTFTPGNRVDYSYVTQWFVKLRDEYEIIPLWIGYDNWNAQYFTTEMESNRFVMEQVIQGAKTMSPAMKQMEAEFSAKRFNYDNNPVLKWNLTNTQVKQDANANIRPIKGTNDKLRIDGTVSLIDAYVIYMRHFEDYHNLI